MQISWWFAYNYGLQKWEVHLYYHQAFGGYIYIYKTFFFNFGASVLNHRKHMGIQEDIEQVLNSRLHLQYLD